ncbi:MAG TPA: dimethylsulfoniopropionate demethylase, partial [Afifellaceae bacterium]|nr:dimethylsulfoniopropionate demethylase [Afifellaceae bacterium]
MSDSVSVGMADTDRRGVAPVGLLTTSRIRRSPFADHVEAAGVKGYTVYNHMLLPLVYRSLEEDYRHLKEHVQLWDVAAQRQVEISGPDSGRLVQWMTPRDLSWAEIGQCFYAPLVDETGGMVNDPVILKLADDRFWLSLADSDVLLWARGLASAGGFDVAIAEPDVSPLAVQGPKSEDLMAAVFGEAVRAIGFFRFARLAFDGHDFVVARSGWSKQGGFEIYVDDATLAGDLWDTLLRAGAPFGVGPGCPNVIERIEGGLLSYGGDMTLEHNPFECGLGTYCHLDRPIAFLGRERLEAIQAAGIERQIRGLVIDVPSMPFCTTPWPVSRGGETVGQVTSAAFSPDAGRGLA